MNRKKFLTSASLLAMGTLSGPKLLGAVQNRRETVPPTIDAHQHLWDNVRFNEGWSASPNNLNFDMKAYKSAILGLNIVKSIYVEVAVPADKRYEEALYAIEMCADPSSPTAGAVIAADLSSVAFRSYLAEFKGNPFIKGIRYRFNGEDDITSKTIVKNVRTLGKMNLSFDFSVQPKLLSKMAELVRLCPDTQFMVNHCANVDPKAFFAPEENVAEKPNHDREEWIRDVRKIASYENTACKISGVVTRVLNHPLTAKNLAPAVNHCLDIFGPDRVMFASDWPVCLKKMEMKSWLNILKEIVSDRPYDEQKKLFHDNALRLYRI